MHVPSKLYEHFKRDNHHLHYKTINYHFNINLSVLAVAIKYAFF